MFQKRRLERIAVKYGAIIEQNVTSGKTFCYVATMEKARAQLVIKSGYCNVVKTAWLLDCENRYLGSSFFGFTCQIVVILKIDATKINSCKLGFLSFITVFFKVSSPKTLVYALHHTRNPG